MARKKKDEISSQLRQTWLKKHQSGQSIFKLSVEYQRDPRTIKHHIERALREKEAKEARVIVIRDALQNHHARLVSYAQRLHGNVDSGEPVTSSLLEDRMYGALKSHLPRSPLWKYLNRLNNLYEKLDELKTQLRKNLLEEIENDTAIPNQESIHEGLRQAFLFQVIDWAKGHSGISLKESFKVHSLGNGKSAVDYGSFHFGEVADSDVPRIRAIIKRWEGKLTQRPEYDDAKAIFDQLNSIKLKTKEELAVIFERGVVPGSCKYCPA